MIDYDSIFCNINSNNILENIIVQNKLCRINNTDLRLVSVIRKVMKELAFDGM